MDRGAWWTIVHGVAKSWTWLSNWAHIHSQGCIAKMMKLQELLQEALPDDTHHRFFMVNISLRRNVGWWGPSKAKFPKFFLWAKGMYGEGNGNPLQYSCLENPMDGGAWWAAVHGVARSLTWLSNFTFTFHFHALEKERATHSSVLAWRIPGTGEPGGLPSMGSHRVGHDWSNLAAAAAKACRGLPRWLSGRESACNAGEGLIPGSGRSPREENGNPLQYSCLKYSVDREVWWAIVYGVTKESDMT